ncbi:MAG: hypothetical protein MN733_37760 [Nitrososphaera sp.]|nr:hypothetical protein [Nitrososphaera sp.]
MTAADLQRHTIYCKFSEEIEGYLAYMDQMMEDLRGRVVLMGLDANAESGIWFSKTLELNWPRARRGEALAELILERNLIVLNESSPWYTFDGPNGSSDIDVTLVSKEGQKYNFEWKILRDRGVSDHSVILLEVGDQKVDAAVRAPTVSGWSMRDVKWDEWENNLRTEALAHGEDEWKLASVDEKVNLLNKWVHLANKRNMKELNGNGSGKIYWWNDDLRKLRAKVRKERKRLQRAKKRNDECLDERKAEYLRCANEYKRQMKNTRANRWKKSVNI